MIVCCPCFAVLSVPCSSVVTCWGRADLLALLHVFFLVCVFHFPICVLVHFRTRDEVSAVRHI